MTFVAFPQGERGALFLRQLTACKRDINEANPDMAGAQHFFDHSGHLLASRLPRTDRIRLGYGWDV
jgi:hypothetical protein